MNQGALIPALTIWQPWATLIIAGVDPFVIPNWSSQHIHAGATVAIHAAARPARKSEVAAIYLKHRSGTAPAGTFGDRDKVLAYLEAMRDDPLALPLAAILGTVVLGAPIAASLGSLAFPVHEIVAFAPIPAKGKQGFWMWKQARQDRMFA